MDIKTLQDRVNVWAQQFKKPYWNPLSINSRLAEELGELSRELNSRYGDRIRKPGEKEGDIGEEIGDIIFALVCLANSHGIDLDKVMEEVISEKCYIRDNNRFESKNPLK